MAQVEKKTSRNQNRETQKKRMITNGFQVGRIGFRPDGKEEGKVELPKW